MHDSKDKVEISVVAATLKTFWPTPQDYNEAVQNPQMNLRDPDLQAGSVHLSAHGLPRPISGAFASVYQINNAGKDWALRCFLRCVPDAQERYARISQFVHNDKLPYTVDFDYQAEGIEVAGNWFPILKMEWVHGHTLDQEVKEQIAHGKLSPELCEKFKKMHLDLLAAGIAHGDLQCGNIMVNDRELYLVDYDGMYVPAMLGQRSNELGHRNFQHPRRTADTFGPYLDNFSAWVIYTSLKALAVDPKLYDTLAVAESCLLFRKEDFMDPLHSPAFAALERHTDEEIRKLGTFVRAQLERQPDAVPPLTAAAEITAPLQPIGPDVPKVRPKTDLLLHKPDRPAGNSVTASATAPAANRTLHSSALKDPELAQLMPRRLRFIGTWGKNSPEFWYSIAATTIVVGLALLAAAQATDAPSLLFCIGAGSAALLTPTFSLRRERLLVETGIATTGEILGVRQEYDGSQHRWYLQYAYQRGGQLIDKEERVSEGQSMIFRKGDRVSVLYSPKDDYSALYALCSYRAIP